MLNVREILVSAIGLAVLGVGLAGCGQRGPLTLPNDPAAANRATLPQTLLPIPPRSATTVVVPEQEAAQNPAQKPAGSANSGDKPDNTPSSSGTAR